MRTALLILCVLIAVGCATARVGSPNTEIVRATELAWQHLNPARGDKGPRAATLWGDRNGSGPTGFLVRFVDGFSSPPHIHNVSYRGVVIRGLVHNGDPKDQPVWMPPGSYWTQPKGGVHITAARGGDTVAYIEIEEGPYLVRPVDQAFDAGVQPVNIDAAHIAWAPVPDMERLKLALLWGDPTDDAPSGTLVRLPAGATGALHGHGTSLRAVLIQGHVAHRGPIQGHAKTLGPGSYFGSRGPSAHVVACAAERECVIYVRAEGKLAVVGAPPAG